MDESNEPDNDELIGAEYGDEEDLGDGQIPLSAELEDEGSSLPEVPPVAGLESFLANAQEIKNFYRLDNIPQRSGGSAASTAEERAKIEAELQEIRLDIQRSVAKRPCRDRINADSEFSRKQSSDARAKLDEQRTRQIAIVSRQLHLLAWVAATRYLNAVLDDRFIQAVMLSQYSCTQRTVIRTDPATVFKFMVHNYKFYSFSRGQFLFHHPPATRFIRGAYRKQLYRGVQRRCCSERVGTLLFIALCRSLRLNCRLVMTLPQPQVVERTPVCRASPSAASPARKRPRSPQASPLSFPDGLTVWAEVFARKQRRWIAIDVGGQRFDCEDELRGRRRWQPRHPKSTDFDDASVLISKVPTATANLKSAVWASTGMSTLHETEDGTARGAAISYKSSQALNSLLLFNTSQGQSSGESSSDDDEDEEAIDLGEVGDSGGGAVHDPGIGCTMEPEDTSASLGNQLKVALAIETSWQDTQEHKSSAEWMLKWAPAAATDAELEEENESYAEELASFMVETNDKLRPSELRRAVCSGDVALFVLACTSGGLMRDVSRRYSERWSAILSGRTADVENYWTHLVHSLQPAVGTLMQGTSAVDGLDEFALQDQALKEKLPTSRSGFKKHHKYALESLLGQREILMPREPIVGYFQGEAVYLRSNVQRLRTALQWGEENRNVIDTEIPLRSLALSDAQLKRKRKNHHTTLESFSGGQPSPAVVQLYAEWQTEPLPPAQICDGKIPVDSFRRVNLIGKKAPPDGTVHLAGRPGIEKVAYRLSIQSPMALVGFDYKGGQVKPKLDGIVVMEKDVPRLLEEFVVYEEAQAERKRQRTRDSVLHLWRLLFKGLLAKHVDQKEKMVTQFNAPLAVEDVEEL